MSTVAEGRLLPEAKVQSAGEERRLLNAASVIGNAGLAVQKPAQVTTDAAGPPHTALRGVQRVSERKC